MPSKTRSSSGGSPKKSASSRSKSRSRSRSRTRKPASTATRSRSRSAGRVAKKPSPAKQTAAPKTPQRPKRSPGRPSPSRATEAPTTPTRTSLRIQEKLIGDTVAASSSDQMVTGQQHAYDNPKQSDPDLNAACLSPVVVIDCNNNATMRRLVTKLSTKDQVDASTAAKPATSPISRGASSNGSSVGMAAPFLVAICIALSYAFVMACDKRQCTIMKLPHCSGKWSDFLNGQVAVIVLAYYAILTALSMLPIGPLVEGMPSRSGQRLVYRCNGMLTLLAAAAGVSYAAYRDCPLTYVHDHLLQFLTSGVILSLFDGLVILMLVWNCPAKDRSPSADGTFWNDFWVGRALNPRWYGLDIKLCMFRCGLVTWIVINWLYLAAQYKATNTCSPALTLTVICQTLFVTSLLKDESRFFTSLDYTENGVGYLLCWATAVMMPYIYSMQARFLYMYPNQGVTNYYLLAAIFVFYAFGLTMFNGSNWQKSEFRKNPYNPALSHLSSMPTETGKRLLTSGWWGMVRRPNYLGDLIVAWAISLPCGFNYVMPYFYPVLLAVMLVSRCLTDEASCKERYGKDWDKYTAIVKYRLIPYVF